jgi:hypothetical protein
MTFVQTLKIAGEVCEAGVHAGQGLMALALVFIALMLKRFFVIWRLFDFGSGGRN